MIAQHGFFLSLWRRLRGMPFQAGQSRRCLPPEFEWIVFQGSRPGLPISASLGPFLRAVTGLHACWFVHSARSMGAGRYLSVNEVPQCRPTYALWELSKEPFRRLARFEDNWRSDIYRVTLGGHVVLCDDAGGKCKQRLYKRLN
jgi:hypothetical protein